MKLPDLECSMWWGTNARYPAFADIYPFFATRARKRIYAGSE
jgi:hypothetical protein